MKVFGVLGLAVLLVALVAPVSAQGGVTSAVVPAAIVTRVGQPVTVSLVVDMRATADRLGSYTAYLTWDPAVLRYKSYTGAPPAGFAGVVNTQLPGRIIANGANFAGATGQVTLITVTFDALKVGKTALDVNYTAMAAAGTFESLLPVLTVTDGQAQVKRK